MILDLTAINDFLDGLITKDEFVVATHATDAEIQELTGDLGVGVHELCKTAK